VLSGLEKFLYDEFSNMAASLGESQSWKELDGKGELWFK
jgi:hypothetical protein